MPVKSPVAPPPPVTDNAQAGDKMREAFKAYEKEREERVRKEIQPLADPKESRLDKAVRVFVKEIVSCIAEEFRVSLGEAITTKKPEPESISWPKQMWDSEALEIGYYLEDIQSMYSAQMVKDFLMWYKEKGYAGGIFEGKYYIIMKDFNEFLTWYKNE